MHRIHTVQMTHKIHLVKKLVMTHMSYLIHVVHYFSNATCNLFSRVVRATLVKFKSKSCGFEGCCGCCWCCSCCVYQLLFNVTLGAGFGVASLLKIYSISALSGYPINAISWLCGVGEYRILICVSNVVFMVLFLRNSDQNYGVVLPCLVQMDSGLCRRRIVELCHSLFVPESIHCLVDVILPVVGIKRTIHQFWTYLNTTRVSLNNSLKNKEIKCCPRNTRFSFCYCFHESAFEQCPSSKSRASFCANAFNSTGLFVSQRLEPSGCLASWS